jgi:hypothetical protein
MHIYSSEIYGDVLLTVTLRCANAIIFKADSSSAYIHLVADNAAFE